MDWNNAMKKIMTFAVITSLILALMGCGNTSLYTEVDSTYKTITDIPGISFAIPSSVSTATAINRITSDMEFDSSTTYSYKDGASTFIVFNMENIVILVEKGTDFGFDLISEDGDKSEGLNNSPVINTWLSYSGKSFSYEEGLSDGVYKLIADVKAEVSITTRVFGDFTGKLAVVTDGTTEYALFIGAPDDVYEQLSGDGINIIDTVAKSLKMTYVEEREESDETVSESSTESTSEVISETDTELEDSSETEDTESTVEVSVEEQNNDGSEESTIEVSVSESIEETEETEEKAEETVESADDGSLNLDNQNNTAVEADGSYYSNVYSALRVGDSGKFITSNDSADYQQAVITITKHYGQDEAATLIKKYCTQGKTGYEYVEAPEGTHWEAVEYSLDKTGVEGEIYANIKFTGLDGEKLYFKGIGYSTRTYDITANVNVNENVETGYICYYAVPNGCDEYMLVVGDSTENKGFSVYDAYYAIESED